jgi:hypothetical protein
VVECTKLVAGAGTVEVQGGGRGGAEGDQVGCARLKSEPRPVPAISSNLCNSTKRFAVRRDAKFIKSGYGNEKWFEIQIAVARTIPEFSNLEPYHCDLEQ